MDSLQLNTMIIAIAALMLIMVVHSAATAIANYDMAAESCQTEEDSGALHVPPYSSLG